MKGSTRATVTVASVRPSLQLFIILLTSISNSIDQGKGQAYPTLTVLPNLMHVYASNSVNIKN